MLASTVRKATRASPRPFLQALSRRQYSSKPSPAPSAESASSSKPSSSQQVYLTADRKRKLVTLYHKAEKFVTHENLSTYIDNEFVRPGTGYDKVFSEGSDGRRSLYRELDKYRAEANLYVIPSAESEASRSMVGFARSNRPNDYFKKEDGRGRRLRAAVYGTDDSLKASLEMVEEYRRSGSVDTSGGSK